MFNMSKSMFYLEAGFDIQHRISSFSLCVGVGDKGIYGDLIFKFPPGVWHLTSQFIKFPPILHLAPTGWVEIYNHRRIINST